jgi:hypothetical protein
LLTLVDFVSVSRLCHSTRAVRRASGFSMCARAVSIIGAGTIIAALLARSVDEK